jgi:desulfoferrodoxin (superoxide reductase-like protein)
MKTAMKELIEKLEQKGDASVNVSIGRMQISIKEEEYIDLIEQALEKEKEQIKYVFEHCWNHPNWEGEYDIKDMND